MKPREREDLVSRWGGSEAGSLAVEVVERLRTGAPLDDLPVGRHEGRVDIRGLPVARPRRSQEAAGSWRWTQLAGLTELRGVGLRALDLSGASLDHLRFFDVDIHDCRLEWTSCRDWRLWGCTVTDTTFIHADLATAVLGSWYNDRGNVYRRVSFARADLRRVLAPDGTFEDCDFSYARIERTRFGSSDLIRCRFAGTLREIQFYARDPHSQKPTPNPMDAVDFSDAVLRDVEFRGLDLDRVQLPRSARHLLIRHYRCVLMTVLAQLEGDDSDFGRGTKAYWGNRLHWAGPHQQVGVFNVDDAIEANGQEEADRLVRLLSQAEEQCAAGAAAG